VLRLLDDAPQPLAAEESGIVAMLVAVALTLLLVVWQHRVARLTGSRVVRADALHYLGDLIPNAGAIVSLAASAWLGLGAIDSIVALAAAAILATGALRIGRGAWNALMDRAADPATVAEIESLVRDWPGVRGFHDLKTRTAGSRIFVNLHLELDGEQPLAEAHAIGAALRREIMARLPQADVIIHHDPV
jgi:ferrous-iron efflux pump FieF